MYQLRAPAGDLAAFIEHYWFVSDADGDVDLRVDVFVDARADLIFNFGVPYRREVIGSDARTIAVSNFDAQRTMPIRILQRGRVRVSGARFRLGGVGALARVPLRPFTNTTAPLDAVFGEEASALELALRDTPAIDAQAQLLDAFFSRRVRRSIGFERFERALGVLTDGDGGPTIEAMADAAGVSSRQVDRLFARYLGVAPKTMSRVLRFQKSLRMLMDDPRCTLADVAASCGYFDQAHFVKDFRRMSGGVPRGYRGYFPASGPRDFAPNVVVFLQDVAPGPS